MWPSPATWPHLVEQDGVADAVGLHREAAGREGERGGEGGATGSEGAEGRRGKRPVTKRAAVGGGGGKEQGKRDASLRAPTSPSSRRPSIISYTPIRQQA